MVNEGSVEPVILLSKTDLISADDLNLRISEIEQAGIQNEILTLSSITEHGLSKFQQGLE